MANGVFLYVIKTKNAQGQEQQWVGKLAILDGVLQVGLPPELSTKGSASVPGLDGTDRSVRAQVQTINDDLQVNGSITATNTGTNPGLLKIESGTGFAASVFDLVGHDPTNPNDGDFGRFSMRADLGWSAYTVRDVSASTWNDAWRYFYLTRRLDLNPSANRKVTIDGSGNLGLGTTTPSAALDIHASTANLIRAVNATSGQAVFRVENDGDVFADGSYNCGLGTGCFNSGQGADVAERINATEPLEPGDVVEVDPDNPGKFRKAREAMSRRVAGVISTAPAITLGNDFDPEAERWVDHRPLLALAGRVPVKAVAKFGAIEVGDLLVASPIPGYAMKCPETSQCVGAIIGKALEPLKEGVGLIEVQVMLR